MEKSILKINKRIKEIKIQLASLENLRAGSLSEKYNVCGKAGCRCKDKKNPEKHGPYNYLSYYKNKKMTNLFIKKENLKTIKDEIKNHALLKSLIEEWVSLTTELSNYRIAMKKDS